MSRLMIIGAGALARQVHSLFKKDYDIIGFLDKPKFAGETLNGCPVINDSVPDCEYIMAVSDPQRKKRLAEIHAYLPFTSLIHPTAIISEYTVIPDGTIIYPYAIIDPNVTLGKHLFIGYYTFVGHHAIVGDYSTLGNFAAISGYTKIEKCAYIGTHAVTVNERYREHCLTLGENCRVGSGAVVTKDVEKGATVVGVPAKPMS